ncbi:MAG: putative transporter, permease protein [Thermoleophilia bacterium]|nr:putative transporter, permease protein [Thermoleophilia bacterium]
MNRALSSALLQWQLAWRAEVGRRASFLLQLLFMCINDLAWVVFWLLVFSHRDAIRGWDRAEVLVLFAIVTFTYGIGIGMFYGVRRLGERIRRRELDPWLAQPQPIVLRVLFSRIHPPLLGDLVFGPVLFALAGSNTPGAWLRYIGVALLASAIITAFLLATESLTFWLDTGSEFAGVAFTAITVLSTYPASIYSGVVKLVVFTIVPAAFIGSVPAEVVLDPSARLVGMLVLAAVASWVVALSVFHLGVRRYLRVG